LLKASGSAGAGETGSAIDVGVADAVEASHDTTLVLATPVGSIID
jgi:hypothetical protein